jgi:hypothetical protein
MFLIDSVKNLHDWEPSRLKTSVKKKFGPGKPKYFPTHVIGVNQYLGGPAMPRGQVKESAVRSAVLGGERLTGRWPRTTAEDTRAAIEKDVSAFAWAWFAGDAPAMMRCLHPDYLNRVMGVRGGADPERLVQSVVGLQGKFGSKTAPARRSLEVRVLDVRSRSASAVALLGEWVLHVHLAWAGARWSIVNAMWEMA